MLTVSTSKVDDTGWDEPELTKALIDEMLAHGVRIRVKGRGFSMYPFIQTGDMLLIEPKTAAELKIGDLVLFRRSSGMTIVHRLIKRNGSESLITRGDGLWYNDPPILPEQVLGRVIEVERNGHRRRLDSPLNNTVSVVWARFSPISQWLRPVIRPFWRLYLRFR